MNFLNSMMAGVGYVFVAFVVLAIIYVIVMSIRESYKKSDRYARRKRQAARAEEDERTRQMFREGLLTVWETRDRLDRNHKEGSIDV